MKLRTLNEAAAALGVTRRKLREGIRKGLYPAIQWGNRLLVDVDELGPIIEAERQRKAERADMIGLRECADAIGLSAETLRRMAVAGLVPYERSGRYYRFRLEDVENAIRNGMK